MGIVVDLFAGGGGATEGIELARGRAVEVAINHDPFAIAMHRANHPETEHYCESVWDVDPIQAVSGREVDFLWASPDCRHFSNAKGGRPVEQNIRGLAWSVIEWLKKVRPRAGCVENVPEFSKWGPLGADNRPIPELAGETFMQWIGAIRSEGYAVEWKVLRASDYGAPTSRMRLFIFFRCDGLPIVWPDATHGDPKSIEVIAGICKPWRIAGEIIDWTITCPSIFERQKKDGTPNPLAENTLKRIASGLDKFVINNPEPFLVPDEFLQYHGGRNNHSDRVAAFLTKYHGDTVASEGRGQSLHQPLYTLDTSNRFGLVTAHMIKMRNNNDGHRMDEPLHTITAGGLHLGVIQAYLIKYYGQGDGQDLNEPLHTITSKDTFGLVSIYGDQYLIYDIGMRMLQPHELFAGQGFGPHYQFRYDADGRAIPKTEQVKKCGNSVVPHMSECMFRANMPDLCRVPLPGEYTSVAVRASQMELFEIAG